MIKIKNLSQYLDRLLLFIAKIQKENELWAYIIVNFSAVWIPFLYSFFGVKLNLVSYCNSNIQITSIGLLIFILFVLINVIGNGTIFYANKKLGKNPEIEELKSQLQEKTENGFVLRDINSSTNKICENKLATLLDKVIYFIENPKEIPPEIITNPQKQLDSLSKELSICLAELLKFQERRYVTDLFTSIIYRFPQESVSQWYWATTERGLSILDLTTTHNGKISIFQHLLNSKGHIIFKNSKQKAYEAKCYIPDNEDEYDDEGNLKGSIACFQFEIKKHNLTVIEFIITITSYSQQFAQNLPDNDPYVLNIKRNLDKVVIPNYIIRAKIELCLLYLQHLKKTRS